MPGLTVCFVRIALCYFAAGITLGALLLIEKATHLSPQLWRLLPLHTEFMLMGWTLQLIMGIGYWIFPRVGSPARRGNIPLAVVAIACLNAGIMLTLAGQSLPSGAPLILAGRMLELASVLAYLLHLWPRIRGGGVSTHS